MGKVLWGDIGNNGNVKKQGQLLFAPGGQGQGCAQQHRRDGGVEKRCRIWKSGLLMLQAHLCLCPSIQIRA
jgi:hypothetical protein